MPESAIKQNAKVLHVLFSIWVECNTDPMTFKNFDTSKINQLNNHVDLVWLPLLQSVTQNDERNWIFSELGRS